MTTYDIRPATAEDVDYLATRLRDSDVREVKASHGLEPWEAIKYSRLVSDICNVMTADHVPICIFGRSPMTKASASVWLLGTDAIKDHRREFMRQTRRQFPILHEGYWFLFNYVDARNHESIAWLKRAGATFVSVTPLHGVARIPFFQFIHLG